MSRYVIGAWSVSWLLLFAYWLIAAAGAKRNVHRRRHWPTLGLRLAMLVFVVAAVRFGGGGPGARAELPGGPAVGALGAGLKALGLAFAAWARAHLGSNWGMPMSVKRDPALVSDGPYAFVRHPIYTGLLLAMLASALVVGIWFLPMALMTAAYMVYSARREERTLLGQFPEPYAAYMRRTKMLIPFLY